MEGYILLVVIIMVIVIVILLNRSDRSENATFTTVSSSPAYPISYIQGVRIGRKILDPNYHDPAIYGTPKQYLGPS